MCCKLSEIKAKGRNHKKGRKEDLQISFVEVQHLLRTSFSHQVHIHLRPCGGSVCKEYENAQLAGYVVSFNGVDAIDLVFPAFGGWCPRVRSTEVVIRVSLGGS